MLAVSNLHKTFNAGTVNEVHALRGVSLDLPEGAFLVILGGNGSGKSTLLNAVAGTFRLDQGAIHLDGQDITRWQEHQRARLIGRVFQNPFTGTAPGMSIAENLALAVRRGQRRQLGWALPRKLLHELRDRVSQLKMGLEDRLGNAIGSLSGGQRQALTLYYFSDLSASQAAEILDLSVSALEALLVRGKRSLRAMLQRQGIGGIGDLT